MARNATHFGCQTYAIVPGQQVLTSSSSIIHGGGNYQG
jgi:hypothetical protein